MLHALRAGGRPLAGLCGDMRMYPQVLVNVRVRKGFDLQANAAVQAALKAAETRLKGTGRVLLRASGTEPVIRVMVEGEGRKHITQLADALAETIRAQAHARA